MATGSAAGMPPLARQVPPPGRLLLVGDQRKGGSAALVDRHAEWLRSRGCSVAVLCDREAAIDGAAYDCVVVFGGDGSLLAAARRLGQQQVPTLGINRGRLGFLTAFELEQATEALELLLAGKLVEEPRQMFHCSAAGGGTTPFGPVLGLNDVVISRAAVGGMITVRVRHGDSELATYRGDGLIVATAVGSTAYSMAAGGPVLAPDLDALVLTPLASHTLSARPLVLPVGDGVDVELLEAASKPHAWCQVDGQVQMQLQTGGKVQVRPAQVRFRHLVPGPAHFFRVLRGKFGFADLPRPRL